MKIKEVFIKNLMSGNFTRNILLFLPRLLKKIIKKFDLYIQTFARRNFGRSIKVVDNKILFINFQGMYTCNPKAICDEIIRQDLPYELVFVVSKENKLNDRIMSEFPIEVKIVQRGSYAFYQEAASAKIWVDNSINMEYLNVRKKKEQVLFQTWHGSLGLKKMTKDSVLDKKWVKKAIKYGKKTDYCISNSKFETEVVYKNNYWEKSEILEYGHPRNDILINVDDTNKKIIDLKVRKYFNISSDKKILLYAPTFREDKTLDYYNIDYDKLREALEKKFDGEWVILSRLHFKLRKLSLKIKYDENILDATDYIDIQDLILTCDIGITDYSSWICDLVLTNKPGFLYTPDIEAYDSERGLFYPISETPFLVAKNNEDLIKNIMSFDDKSYEIKRQLFLEKRGCIESGNASKLVVEKIKSIIEGEVL